MNTNICLYLIGHTPDKKYFKPLLESVKGFVAGVFYCNTDGEQSTCCEFSKISRELNIHCVFENYDFRDDFHFGKARNTALNSAKDTFQRCDWFLWLDCDDILEGGENILKNLALNQSIDLWDFPYQVEGAGFFTRERLHKRGIGGKWVNRVHEIFTTDKASRAIMNDVKVIHSKEQGDNTGESHDFHIALCKQEIENAPNYYLYIGKEYFNSGRPEKAKEFLTYGEVLTECKLEKYNANLLLSKIAANDGDKETEKELLIKALQVDPNRREAYYYLAVQETMAKRFDVALGYIRAACALPKQPLGMQEDNLYEGGECLILMYRLLSRIARYDEAYAVSVELIKGLQSAGLEIATELTRETRILGILTENE